MPLPTETLADNLPLALLAGGLATRLRPITEKIPKSLVNVAGRPFLAHQLAALRAQGVRRVVLCIGHLGEMIEREFGDGRDFGVELRYAFDGPVPLGTGGALRQAIPLLKSREFFVLYGDSFLPTDFRAVAAAYRTSGQTALMTVFRNQGRWDTSNTVFRDGMVVRYHKRQPDPEMEYIDYGLSVFSTDALADAPPVAEGVAFDLADWMENLVASGRLAGHEVRERFYEIGSHAGLAELDALLRAHPPGGNVSPPEISL